VDATASKTRLLSEWINTHGAEVSTEALDGGLDSGDLGGAAGAGRAAESLRLGGRSDLAAVGSGLGDSDDTLLVGRNVDDLVVGEARVLARVEVEEVALLSREDGAVGRSALERVPLADEEPLRES